METIKYWFDMIILFFSSVFEEIAKKLGLEEKYENFKYWLDGDPSRKRIVAAVILFFISLLVWIWYWFSEMPDL